MIISPSLFSKHISVMLFLLKSFYQYVGSIVSAEMFVDIQNIIVDVSIYPMLVSPLNTVMIGGILLQHLNSDNIMRITDKFLIHML